ncbi:unnamed protein product, partial [marine sediment metagenome]
MLNYLNSGRRTHELNEHVLNSLMAAQAVGATFEAGKLSKKESEWTDAFVHGHVSVSAITQMRQQEQIGRILKVTLCAAPGDEPSRADTWLDMLSEPTRH